MSEIIFSLIGNAIWYVYMVAVVAFVALQFGWIKRPGQVDDNSSSKREVSASPKPGDFDLGNMMKGLMSQMGPAINQAVKGSLGVPAPDYDEVPSGMPLDLSNEDSLEALSRKTNASSTVPMTGVKEGQSKIEFN